LTNNQSCVIIQSERGNKPQAKKNNNSKEIKIMITFINIVNSIPESIGWAIAGTTAVLAIIGCIHFAKFAVQVWKEWHEEENTEE
jgi:hypothetical protein